VIAIRREDAHNWPCPWLTSDLRGCGSRPDGWSLAPAREYVSANRTSSNPLAVYHVRGVIQSKIFPPEGR
jgi:hypothetical protein